MIASILYFTAAFFVFAHGLVHLIGVVVYWQLAEVEDFPPNNNTLLNVAGRSAILGCGSMDYYG